MAGSDSVSLLAVVTTSAFGSFRASGTDDRRVSDWATLRALGFTRHEVAAQLAACRWQRHGSAIVLHNGPLTRAEVIAAALINAGPRSVLTSFTAAEVLGLKGWDRPAVHVLVPSRSHVRSILGVPIRTHYVGDWSSVRVGRDSSVQVLPQAVVRAASSFAGPRPGCGLLAATIQQRLTTVASLRWALEVAVRTRHRAAFVAAVEDIGQGAQALSEIDFRRLCRRFGLPAPDQQTVRVEPSGRRRYLDATWRRADGRLVVVEVDGAHHLHAGQWEADQHRQNEIAVGGAIVLRFSSVVVRQDPSHVADQIRRAIYSVIL